MTSKAQRKRRKGKARAKTSLPGGVTVEQIASTDKRKPKEDPMQTVLDARRRFMGDKADKVDLRSAMTGDDLGRALLKAPPVLDGIDGKPDEAYTTAILWEAVTHIRRTVAAYDRACGAPARHPKCLSILTPPDRLEATAESPAWDDRPQEERDRAAVSAYMALQGWLGHTDARARSACIRAVVDDAGVSDLPGIILALQCVADGRAGRKMLWRGRSDR